LLKAEQPKPEEPMARWLSPVTLTELINNTVTGDSPQNSALQEPTFGHQVVSLRQPAPDPRLPKAE